MKTLGLIAAVFYLGLTVLTQTLMHQGGAPLGKLAAPKAQTLFAELQPAPTLRPSPCPVPSAPCP